MTISQSMLRRWPADRIERVRKLQTAARAAGLKMTAKNTGGRNWLMFLFSFSDGASVLATFFDIAEAEQWLAARLVEQWLAARLEASL